MNAPRLLPLIGVALGGVLALKALSGVTALPDMLQGAQAFAEETVAKVAPKDAGKGGAKEAGKDPAKPADPNAPPVPPGLSPKSALSAVDAAVNASAATLQGPRLACGPTAADLAKEAGLSPAELQVLQSLGARRGQLDQRESDLDIQLKLMSAAEAKLDAKLTALTAMKKDIQALLDRADLQKSSEIDRLVIVYSQMKPKDAAARMTLLDDSVRLPIAAKMKERALSAILGLMPPAAAKDLTEKLARRFESKALADARSAISQAPPQATAAATPPPLPAGTAAPAAQTAQAAPATAPAAKPARTAKAKPRPKAKPTKMAAAAQTPTPEKPQPYTPPVSTPAPAAAAAPKAG